MDYLDIKRLIASPAIRLFRKDSAGFVLYFLYSIFQKEERFFLNYDEMRARLRHSIEEIEEEELSRDVEFYINDWVSNRFLFKRIRIIENREEIILEPSPELSKVFFWLEDLANLEKKEVIGTESKFFSILHKLRQLVDESETDPLVKIAQLEAKKKELEEQIELIKLTGIVDTLSKERIKGQYLYAKKEALELISDFKQVEVNFAEIRSNIHKKYLATSLKGEILEYVLNEDLELMNSEQGKSFNTFWEFLRSDRNQEEWNDILLKLYSLDEIRGVDDEVFFRKLRRTLRDAGGQVNSMVSGMNEQLKRSLVERTLKENRRSKEFILSIKSYFINLDFSDHEQDEEFWFWDEFSPVQLTMERPLWKGDTGKEALAPSAENSNENLDWDELISAFRGLDTKQLEDNILSLLRYKPEVSLEEVLEKYPEPANLEVLVAYLWIATRNGFHEIQEDENFEWRHSSENYRYNLPQVIYRVSN